MLLVILVLAVVGVVTLSVANRTISGARSDDTSNESVKAFKAAEAGLERALLSNSAVERNIFDTNIAYEASFSRSGSTGIVTDSQVLSGDGVEVLTANGDATDIRILWNSSSALTLSDYWYSGGVYGVTYYAVDSITRSPVNNFEVISPGSYSFEGVSFNRGKSIALHTGSQFVRIEVHYGDTFIGVVPLNNKTLVDQKVMIDAKGVYTGSEVGGVVRQINYSETPSKLPFVFDHVLYSNGGLTQ